MTDKKKHAPRGGLEKRQLEDLVAQGLSIRAIASALDRSPTTVRYWLDKHGIARRTIRAGRQRVHGSPDETATRIESTCDRHSVTEFALRSSGYYRCLACSKEAVVRWRRNAKLRLIEEAGGACVLCGFDEIPAALQFHHLEPSTKSFGLSMRGLTRSIEKLREEAAKCVLLCSNCHAAVEWGARDLRTIWFGLS